MATTEATSDIDLARLCVRGNRRAQLELFDAHRERVHWIAFRILGSNRDIEDLIQEALIAVFRSLESYRGECALATWVDRITTRTVYRHLSRHQPERVRLELVAPEGATDSAAPEQQLALRDAARRWYALLDRLSPKYRVAYALHVIDGRSIDEVAALMEVSTIATKNRVWRARRMVERRAQADPLLGPLLREWRNA